MTDKTQPEALRLAEQYDYGDPATHGNAWKAAVCTELRRQHARISELEAARFAYASEFEPNGDGDPDVGSIHANIRAMKAKLASIGAGGVQALSAAPARPTVEQVEDEVSMGHGAWDMVDPQELIGAVLRLAASPTPPAEQQAQPAAVYVELPLSVGEHKYGGGLFTEAQMRDFTDRTHALRMEQAAPKAAPVVAFKDARVQAVYDILVDDEAPPACEHWEGFIARRIVDALAAPQQEAQEPATVPRFNCWSTNEGDSWFDHPADAQAIYDCLGNDAKVGDEYELTAGWKSVTARYRITEVVGDGEEYEVECISHPQGNTAPQPAPAPLSDPRITAIEQAIRDYHYALDCRKHGGVAKIQTFRAICNAMKMHWVQGQESERRAALAAQGGK